MPRRVDECVILLKGGVQHIDREIVEHDGVHLLMMRYYVSLWGAVLPIAP
jgi:hypothetical protein